MLILGLQGQRQPIRRDPYNFIEHWTWVGNHDASAALIEDGQVIAAIEEERLSRRKHTGKFPVNAVRFCLDHHKCSLDDVDFIAFGENGGGDPKILAAWSNEFTEVFQLELKARPSI